MRLRTFKAPDRRQAERKMREAMGDDAIVLSERETRSGVEIRAGLEKKTRKKGGFFGFGGRREDVDERREPVVALPDDVRAERPAREERRAPPRDEDDDAGFAAALSRSAPAEPRETRPGQDSAPRQDFAPREARRAEAPAPTSRRSDKPLDRSALNAELEQRIAAQVLQHLRTNLTSKDGSGRAAIDPSSADADPVLRSLKKQIGEHGLGERLLRQIADEVRDLDTEDEVFALATAFSALFRYAPLQLTPLQPVMLCGPTGAGKTSSAAKLAARAIAAGSRASLFTADIGRAGAVEQLRTYAEALDAEFVPVEAPADVKRAMATGRHRGAVILDTPGVSPFDGGDMAALKSFQEAAEAEPLLVLPTSGDPQEHADWAKAFEEFGARRIVLTKFDATRRVGAGVGAAFAHNYALAHFSDTAFIGEGIRDASPEFLARRLLAAEPGRLIDEEDDY